jgi:thiol-disulfide isomerase/thioredoxin
MLRKLPILIILSLATQFLFAKTQDEVIIIGQIDDALARTVLFSFKKNPFTGEQASFEAVTNDNKQFVTKVKLKQPSVVVMKYQNRAMRLYLSPGDTLKLRFNGARPLETATFDGSTGQVALQNVYMQQSLVRFSDWLDESFLSNLLHNRTSKEYYDYIEGIYKRKKDFLDTYPQEKKELFSETFLDYINSDVEYWRAHHLMKYYDVFGLNNIGHPISDYYFHFMNEVENMNFKALNNDYYLSYIEIFLKYWKEKSKEGQALSNQPDVIEEKTRVERIVKPPFVNTKVLEEPFATEKIISWLTKGEEAVYLNLHTAEKFKYISNDTIFEDTYYKVQTMDNKIGWVPASLVNLEEKTRVIRTVRMRNCLDPNSPLCGFEQYLAGKILYFMVAKDIMFSALNDSEAGTEQRIKDFNVNNLYPEFTELLNTVFQNIKADKGSGNNRLRIPDYVDFNYHTMEPYLLANALYKLKPVSASVSPEVIASTSPQSSEKQQQDEADKKKALDAALAIQRQKDKDEDDKVRQAAAIAEAKTRQAAIEAKKIIDAQMEAKRIADAKLAEIEAKRIADAKLAEIEAKKVADAKLAEIEAKKIADAKLAEIEAKKIADAKLTEIEAKKIADAKLAEIEAKKIADAKLAEIEAKKIEEAKEHQAQLAIEEKNKKAALELAEAKAKALQEKLALEEQNRKKTLEEEAAKTKALQEKLALEEQKRKELLAQQTAAAKDTDESIKAKKAQFTADSLKAVELLAITEQNNAAKLKDAIALNDRIANETKELNELRRKAAAEKLELEEILKKQKAAAAEFAIQEAKRKETQKQAELQAAKIAADKLEAEKAKLIADKLELEKAKLAADKLEKAKLAADKLEKEKAKLAAEKLEVEKAKLAAEKLELEKAKLAAEKLELEKEKARLAIKKTDSVPMSTPAIQAAPSVAAATTTEGGIQLVSSKPGIELDNSVQAVALNPNDYKPGATVRFEGMLINEGVPPFSFMDINGKEIRQPDLLGKVVYIDFWATWCAPCKEHIRYIQSTIEETKEKDIVYLFISVDKDTNKWRNYVKENNLGGIHVNDLQGLVSMYWNIQALPNYFLLGKDGRVAINSFIKSKKTLEDMIKYLLATNYQGEKR